MAMEMDGPVMDGTSNFDLPEDISQKIFSLLQRKDAIRASAVSRIWRLAWNSYSVFCFDEDAMPLKNEEFFNYVNTSLVIWRDHCRDSRVVIQRLSLSAGVADRECFFGLRRVIAAAASRNVQVMELCNPRFALLMLIATETDSLLPLLLTCNSLRVLSLKGFEFDVPNSLSLPAISSVWKLTLSCIIIDKNSLENLLSRFPWLKELAIQTCVGFDQFSISCPRLRALEVTHSDDLACEFMVNFLKRHDPPHSVSFTKCKSLTSLHMTGNFNEAWAIGEYIMQIPLLENLILDLFETETDRRSIKICHPNLKSLTLKGHWNLSKAEINTPNLRLFQYSGGIFLISTITFCSGYLDVKLHLTDSLFCSNWFWFTKLRKFLESFTNCEELTLGCYLMGTTQEFRDKDFLLDLFRREQKHLEITNKCLPTAEGSTEELREKDFLLVPFYQLKHLEITNKYLAIAEYASFVDAMVQLFPCVETLSLKTSSAAIFIKFDENRSFSLKWEVFNRTSNTDEYGRQFQSIKASVDKIEELLRLRAEDSNQTQALHQ